MHTLNDKRGLHILKNFDDTLRSDIQLINLLFLNQLSVQTLYILFKYPTIRFV